MKGRQAMSHQAENAASNDDFSAAVKIEDHRADFPL